MSQDTSQRRRVPQLAGPWRAQDRSGDVRACPLVLRHTVAQFQSKAENDCVVSKPTHELFAELSSAKYGSFADAMPWNNAHALWDKQKLFKALCKDTPFQEQILADRSFLQQTLVRFSLNVRRS